MATIKKEYYLKGLCCGNCAAKIKKDISLLPGVESADISVDTAVLSVGVDTALQTDILLNEITRIAVSHDEDIVVEEALS